MPEHPPSVIQATDADLRQAILEHELEDAGRDPDVNIVGVVVLAAFPVFGFLLAMGIGYILLHHP